MPRLVEPVGEDCRLLVRLTPKSSADAVEGIEALADGRKYLKARVRAVPEKGKANAALVKLLASSLRLPASSIRIAAGASSRLKTVHIEAPASWVEARLSLPTG
ncbi:MAG: DUF167 family protein [Rhizobiaceae bacterium]